MNPILTLRGKGYTLKEIAIKLNISKSKVKRELENVDIIDNLKILVGQVIQDLKMGNKTYAFTKKQIESVRKKYPDFMYGNYNGVYVLYPKIKNN